MDLWVEPKQGGGTTVKFGIESQGANLGSVLLWTGDWAPAMWHQVAIHVHWSTDSNQGVVDLWFDGKLVIDAVKHNTKFDNNAMFFNAGMHRVLPKDFTEVLYLDEFTEADSLADINVGAPMPAGGGSGGAAGASAGGSGGGQTEAGASGTGQAAGSGGAATAGGGSGGMSGALSTAGASNGGSANPAAGTGGTSNNGDLGQNESGCQCLISGPGNERGKSGAVLAALALFGLVRRRRHARA
jgi:MYXO-CTERM domain-containing protein